MAIAIRPQSSTAPSWPHMAVHQGVAHIAGRPLFHGNSAALIGRIDELISAGGSRLVVTPNVDQMLALRKTQDTGRAYARADLLLADGAPLVALARMLGDHTIQRLTGADLLTSAVEASVSRAWTIAIVGGADGVATQAAERLADRWQADVVGIPCPTITSGSDPAGRAVATELGTLRPDIVFLCLGSPKQEAWFLEWERLLPDAVYVGAGAAAEFAAGIRKRAPRIVQAFGAEWLWRLAQEPRRLARRYLLKGPSFVAVIIASFVSAQRAADADPVSRAG